MTLLPVSEAWYRRLLVLALLIGGAGGIAALVLSAVTEAGLALFFGEPTSEPWSGKWRWIPLVSAGAVIAVAMRGWWGVSQNVPGAIGYARKGWVDPSSALALFVISTVSLFVGASLGPSFAIIVAGGAIGGWLANRSSVQEEEARHEQALTGMAGGLGAIFSAPLFASIMASELSPTSKKDCVTAFIPQLIAATIGFIIFFGLTGEVMLNEFAIGAT